MKTLEVGVKRKKCPLLQEKSIYYSYILQAAAPESMYFMLWTKVYLKLKSTFSIFDTLARNNIISKLK